MTGVLNDERRQVDLLSILAEIADLDDGRSVARFLGCHFSIQIQQVIIHRLSHVDMQFSEFQFQFDDMIFACSLN